MKFTIEVGDNYQKAIERIAEIDSSKGNVATPEMVIHCAINLLISLRRLPLDKQKLISDILRGNQ